MTNQPPDFTSRPPAEGYFRDHNAPFIAVHIMIEEMELASHVDFLISTGSINTTLMDHDAHRLGLDTRGMEFRTAEYRPGQMIEAAVVPAKIAFIPTYGDPYYQTIALQVAKPSDQNLNLPSVLGTDALRNMQLKIGPEHIWIRPSNGS